MSPTLVMTRRTTVTEVLDAFERGARIGEDGHIIRAAQWLLEQGAAADPAVVLAIKQDRTVHAARHLLLFQGLEFWTHNLTAAVVSRGLRTLPPTG